MTSARITRPRHPLHGKVLQVLGRMRRHGRLELLLVLPDGSKSLVPAAWTDLREAAETGEGGGVTLGSLADLLRAHEVVSALLGRVADAPHGQQAARQSPSKEDHRATRAAQSDAGTGSGASYDTHGSASRSTDRGGDHPAGCPDREGGDRRRADGSGR